jgi:mono/diheme cytochrome c family protein
MPLKTLIGAGAAALGLVLLLLLGATMSLAIANKREIASLRAQLTATRALLPTQSSAMAGVDFQASSLWYAAEAGNWALADFLLAETEEHIEWAVDLQPVRQTADGSVDLRPLYENMRSFSLKDLGLATEAQDQARFRDAYGFVLEQCHGCHVAAGLGELRPRQPAAPGSQMLTMAPPPAG